jgi:hypothetical protein
MDKPLTRLQVLRRMDAGEDLVTFGYGETFLGTFNEDRTQFTPAIQVSEEVDLDMVCNDWIEWVPCGEYGLARIWHKGWDVLEKAEQRRKRARQLRARLQPLIRRLHGWRARRKKGPITYR